MIQIDHVSKSYDGGKTFSVSDLSLEVRDGEIFGILGPNGAGKSTTLNMLVGVLAPTRGTIKIDGIDVAKDPVEAKRRLCFVGDTPDHLLRLRGREYLRFIADIYGRRAGQPDQVLLTRHAPEDDDHGRPSARP